MNTPSNGSKPIIRLATAADRDSIYRLRHDIYAEELGQHTVRPEGTITDALDAFNTYIVVQYVGQIAGFISITPPGFGRYSLDKYISRSEFSLLFDERTFEVRLLTVLKAHRGRSVASLLMYAALRWVQANGGARIIGIGRREVLDLYRKVGMQALEREIRAGAVTFELMTAEVAQLCRICDRHAALLNRMERTIEWRLDFPFREAAKCFHGGAFFDAIGPGFESLERRHQIINADVLDAWLSPAPGVIFALKDDLEWLLRTSPPTDCGGMRRAIACARGVPAESILPGAGSSDLIFLALRHWLKPASRVLLLDPTYGEYSHVLEQVIRCRVERFMLSRREGYQVNLAALEETLRREFDLVILVNPNSPTGRHVPRHDMERLLERIPKGTRVWVDETYVEYSGTGESLEQFAAMSKNIVVCKSMSKVYALSGVRSAYLCASPEIISSLTAITPRWAVSLPAQLAAVRALQDPDYYAGRYTETRENRERLAHELGSFDGWEIVHGTANFLLCHLPQSGLDAADVVRRCRARGLYLRDAAAMGSSMGRHALRIAVKDSDTNRRIVAILSDVVTTRKRRAHEQVLEAPAWLGC